MRDVQRVPERDLQLQLLVLARLAVRQVGEQIETPSKLRDRLRHRSTNHGLLARF